MMLKYLIIDKKIRAESKIFSNEWNKVESIYNYFALDKNINS